MSFGITSTIKMVIILTIFGCNNEEHSIKGSWYAIFEEDDYVEYYFGDSLYFGYTDNMGCAPLGNYYVSNDSVFTFNHFNSAENFFLFGKLVMLKKNNAYIQFNENEPVEIKKLKMMCDCMEPTVGR